MQPSASLIKLAAWGLSVLVATIAFMAWGQGIAWQFSGLSTYRLFPLFGLLAFSLIWSIYVVAFGARLLKLKADCLKFYFNGMSLLITVAILLHPGLLWWQLWRDNFGFPPGSYLNNYVAPGLKWAAILGTIGWVIFLLYEFRYKYRSRSWWKYLEYSADAAIIGLFLHSLFLGTNLHHGWLRLVWYFYGLVLLVALLDLYYRKIQKKPKF